MNILAGNLPKVGANVDVTTATGAIDSGIEAIGGPADGELIGASEEYDESDYVWYSSKPVDRFHFFDGDEHSYTFKDGYLKLNPVAAKQFEDAFSKQPLNIRTGVKRLRFSPLLENTGTMIQGIATSDSEPKAPSAVQQA